MNIKKYKHWAKWLKNHGFEDKASIDTYQLHEPDIKTSSRASLSYTFIKERYFMLFTDDEIKNISDRIKTETFNKRGSIYCVENVARRKNISIEEAHKIVEERKKKTSGALSNYISRYGEHDGKIKWEAFCQKSSHTKSKFIEKYGEQEGTSKWNSYCASKNIMKSYIRKYGETEALVKFKELMDRKSILSKKESLIARFGQEYYDLLIEKRKYKTSLEYLIKEYGHEAGLAKFKLMCSKRDARSYTYFLKKNKFNEEIALKEYRAACISASPILAELTKIYGREEAMVRYTSHDFDKDSLNISIKSSIPHLKSKKGCTSSRGSSFFALLENKLGRCLQYGTKSKELRLFDELKNKIYYYDCFDIVTKTVIEYNGSGFHPRYGEFNFVNVANGKGYEHCYNHDKRKAEFAVEQGYNIIIVWDSEVKRKFDREKKIESLVEILNKNESKKN